MIVSYTSYITEQVLDITYIQYKELIKQVQKKISLDLKIATVAVGATIEECDFPWASEEENKQDRMYIADASRLSNSVNGG